MSNPAAVSGVGFSGVLQRPGERSGQDPAARFAAPAASRSSISSKPMDYVALQRSGDLRREARDRVVHEDRLREEDPAAAHRRDDRRARAASRALDDGGLPALRRSDLARRDRRHRVPAPRHSRHVAAARRLAGDDRSGAAHRVAAQILGRDRAAHRRLLHERRRSTRRRSRWTRTTSATIRGSSR